jgi:diguanylate cyclase (GGDEF)-like protein
VVHPRILMKKQPVMRNQANNLSQLFGSLASAEKKKGTGPTQRDYSTDGDQENQLLLAMLDAMPMGLLFVNSKHRAIYWNPAFDRIWRPVGDKAECAGSEPVHFPWSLLSRLAPDGLTAEGECSTPIEIGDGRFVRCTVHPVRGRDDELLGWLRLYEDVTRDHQAAARLLFLAEHDALTGLYNRLRFQEELARLFAVAERSHRRHALLFFDLDGFKKVNDTHGHRAGDELLIQVAGAVSAQVRHGEFLARLGGDEFAVLTEDVSDQEVKALAERIVLAIAEVRFTFQRDILGLTGSVGAAVLPGHASTADDWVAQADAAMYEAKVAGGNTWRIFGDYG